MAFWGEEREILRMLLQNPFQRNTAIIEAVTLDPLSAVSNQLSMILGSEAQGYWNYILTVAHMVQFSTAYDTAMKARLQEGKRG